MTLSDWKAMDITQEVMAVFKSRIATMSDELVGSAGIDPRLDAFKSGAIAAMKDIVDFHFEEDSA